MTKFEQISEKPDAYLPIEEMNRLQARMSTSEVANTSEAHRDFLLNKILKESCVDESLKQDLYTKFKSLPNKFLERILVLGINIPKSFKIITEDIGIDKTRLVWFLEEFNDDKIRMCFLLEEKLLIKFWRFSYEVKINLLQKAETLVYLKESILEEEFDETRIGSD